MCLVITVQLDFSALTVPEASQNAAIQLTNANPPAAPITITYVTTDGTATGRLYISYVYIIKMTSIGIGNS